MCKIMNFNDAYEKYYIRLYQHCVFAFPNDHFTAEEIANDTMLVLYKKWDTLDFSSDIWFWICKVADNYIKRKKRELARRHSKEVLINEYDDNIPDDSDEIAELTDSYEIKDIIKSLPDELALIFKYRFIDKLTINDISNKLGIPKSTIQLRIEKIKYCVRKFLEL